jgi:hypothetical protein
MTPSKSRNKWLPVVVGVCIVGLLLVPLAQHSAIASPVDLRLDRAGATRVMAQASGEAGGAPAGAAQEEDTQSPKSMEEQAQEVTVTKRPAGSSAKKKEEPPQDRFAFVKDWPFWVIVGGVLVAGVGGYILLKNSNQDGPCAPQFNGGCFGAR